MKKNKKLAMLGLVACLGLASVGAYAVYTGTSATTANTFTIKAGNSNETNASKVGTITEDNWDPANATNLAPNQKVAKDPVFKSAAEYECWVIMKVDIPMVDMKVQGDLDSSVQDSVYLLDSSDARGVNSGWSLVGKKTGATEHDVTSYYYGYGTKLNKGDSTSALFSKIQVPDIVELNANFVDSVDVTATIVQGEGYATVQNAFDSLGISVD